MSRLWRTRKTTPSETQRQRGRSAASRRTRPAFEEGVAVGVEEVAPRGRASADLPCRPPSWISAEEREELRPRAVAVVHRVGVAPGVLAQPLEEAVDRVVFE